MMNKIFKGVLFSLLAVFYVSPVLATTFTIDKGHSRVGFKVSHLIIATVSGQFDDFKGEFEFDEASKQLNKLTADIAVASINTNEADRDKHLRSPDFFNAEKFPSMTFVSNKVDYQADKPVKVHGDLTIVGVTKPVVLDVVYKGMVVDPWGNNRLVFEATTKINRTQWGITWNKTLDKGGLAVGEEVSIIIEGEALAKKDK